jgi:hypothetical protein
MDWVVSATSWPFYPRKGDPVPVVQGDGWTPEPVWTGAENVVPTGIRSPDPPAHSESLYRLHYPSSPILIGLPYKYSHEVRIHFCSKFLKPSHVRQPHVYFKDQPMYTTFWYTELICALIQFSDFRNVFLKLPAKKRVYLFIYLFKTIKITSHSAHTSEVLDII